MARRFQVGDLVWVMGRPGMRRVVERKTADRGAYATRRASRIGTDLDAAIDKSNKEAEELQAAAAAEEAELEQVVLQSMQTAEDEEAKRKRQREAKVWECSLCFEQDGQKVACIPCGHVAACRDCARSLWPASRKCPMCRARIDGMLVVHLP